MYLLVGNLLLLLLFLSDILHNLLIIRNNTYVWLLKNINFQKMRIISFFNIVFLCKFISKNQISNVTSTKSMIKLKNIQSRIIKTNYYAEMIYVFCKIYRNNATVTNLMVYCFNFLALKIFRFDIKDNQRNNFLHTCWPKQFRLKPSSHLGLSK